MNSNIHPHHRQINLLSQEHIEKAFQEADLRGIGSFANLVANTAGADLILGQGIEKTHVLANPEGGTFFQAYGRIFDINGQSIGHYEGTIQPSAHLNLQAITQPPPMPPGPINDPGPIPGIPNLGQNKVTFFFNERDSVTVVGQGSAQLTSSKHGSNIFLITTMNLISGGTGRYRGASGIVSATGTSVLPEGSQLVPGTILHFITFFNMQTVCRNKPAVEVPTHFSSILKSLATSRMPETPIVPSLLEAHESKLGYGAQEQRIKNIRSVIGSVEGLNQRNFQGYMDDFAPDFKMHVSLLPQALNKSESLVFMEKYIEAFPNVKQTITNLFADPSGQNVVYQFIARADGFRGFGDLPPAIGPIEFEGATFYKFDARGLRVKSWNYFNLSSLPRSPPPPSAPNAEQQEYIKRSLATFEAFNRRDFAKMFTRHAPNYTMFGDTLPAPVVGIPDNMQYIHHFVETFPDIKIYLQEAVPFENQVYIRFVARFRETRGFLGLPPISRPNHAPPFEFHAVFINFFEAGLRTKTWQYFDQLHILEQLWPDFAKELPGFYRLTHKGQT